MSHPIIPLIVAIVVIALFIYGIEMVPLSPTPKRVFEAAVVLLAAVYLGHHYHVLGL